MTRPAMTGNDMKWQGKKDRPWNGMPTNDQTMQYNTVLTTAPQYKAMQGHATQCIASHCSAMQHNALQYTDARQNTL